MSDLMEPNGNKNKAFFRLLAFVIALLGLFLALNIIAPTLVSIILNFVGILLLIIVIIFFALGTLVILGMKKEVSKALDIFLEGSLSILDFIQLIKDVWAQFIRTLKEFLIFAAPIFAFILALLLYLLILMLYKWVGREHDVTIMTIILTFILVFVVGVLNRPEGTIRELVSWGDRFQKSFKSSFVDGTEVVLFLFFLTMDSDKLFFLPKEYNIPLHAEMFGYDLMTRSFVFTDHLDITVVIIVATISMELFRNLLRIFAVARKYYAQHYTSLMDTTGHSKMNLLKQSIRLSFKELKEDVVKFITFTTVLFFVFMFFPRLKLLTLVVASLASVILDVIIISRLTAERGNDLITRILAKLFNL
jgi:hypothetical protein